MNNKKRYKFWVCLSLYVFFMGFLGCKENKLAFNPFKIEKADSGDLFATHSEKNESSDILFR